MSRYIDADKLLKEAEKDGAYGYVSAKQIADLERRWTRWENDC